MKNYQKDLNILLIDANEVDANLIQRLLDHIGHGAWISTHVSSLKDGIQVYQAYQEVHPENQSFDCVILTLSLPDSYGMDVIRRFSKIYPNSMIIILTESVHKYLEQDALTMGAFQFLIKEEISTYQLKNAIRSLAYCM